MDTENARLDRYEKFLDSLRQWDENTQRCCTLVELLCSQPLHKTNDSFQRPHNYGIWGMVRNETSLVQEAIGDARSGEQLITGSMRRLHELGYTASTHDLNHEFEFYMELLDCLDIPHNLSAVFFFHGSKISPDTLFEKGFNVKDYARSDSFAGARLYGSVAAKAASFAMPYLYLCMMTWKRDSEISIKTPRNEAEARAMSQNDTIDILLMGSRTLTSTNRYSSAPGGTELFSSPEYFNYPEMAISAEAVKKLHVVPIACFVVDKPFVKSYSTLDSIRLERMGDGADTHHNYEQLYMKYLDRKMHENLEHVFETHGIEGVNKLMEAIEKLKQNEPNAEYHPPPL
jgi:hypothetical protein